MSGERIETAGDLDALPLGSAIVDRQGDTWMLDARYSDGITLWVSPETSRGASGWVAKHYAPFTVVYRPDRDLIAEAEARGARAVADHVGGSAASSDFMAGEVSDVGISWFMAEAREWAENVDGEHVHTYQGAQDPKTGDLYLVCMRCDEVRPARAERTGGDR
jgi:hypothetical protein